MNININNLIIILDNGGKTFDRYTVVTEDAVYCMSANATSPDGINQFSCTRAEWVGKLDGEVELSYDEVPDEVKKAILDRL